MRITIRVCTRCGAESDRMEGPVHRPSGWGADVPDLAGREAIDICPDCLDSYEAWYKAPLLTTETEDTNG